VVNVINDFSDEYRIAEVHGTGTLKNILFDKHGDVLNKNISKLADYWNRLDKMMHNVVESIANQER